MTIPDCIDKKVCVTLEAEEYPFEKTYSLHGGFPLRLGQTSGQVIDGALTITVEDLVKITGRINYLKICINQVVCWLKTFCIFMHTNVYFIAS